MEGAFLLHVVVGQGPGVLELLAGKDQTLLVRWDTFLVLDFLLDAFDRLGRFDLKSDGLAGECFDENLHSVLLLLFFIERIKVDR